MCEIAILAAVYSVLYMKLTGRWDLFGCWLTIPFGIWGFITIVTT